jgi:polysaccharide pyruvyl transferase WcaK-like protein
MIARAFHWIERHTTSGIVAYSGEKSASVAATAGLIPTLLQAARPDLARQYGCWIASMQGEDGAFHGDGRLATLALVARGWLALRPTLPELEDPLRRLGRRMLRECSDGPSFSEASWSIGHSCCSNGLADSFCLHHFSAIWQLGLFLQDDTLHAYATERFQGSLNRLLLDEKLPAVGDFCGFGCALEALMEQGSTQEVLRLLERVGSSRKPDDAAGASWFCTSCQAQLAKAWCLLRQKEHADKIMALLGQIQNSSGGFYGSYGVSAANEPARESAWAAKQVIEASLLQQGFEPIRPRVHNPIPLRGGLPAAEGVPPSVISRRNKRLVTLVVYFEDQNFGDLFIYDTVNERLRQAGLETQTVEVSQSLEQSQLIVKANQSGFLMFVGGGLIERGAPEIIRDFCHVSPLLDSPFGIVGLSAGEFDYRPMAPSFKALADRASFFYTRDAETVEVFKASGAHRLPQEGVDVVFASHRLACPAVEGRRFGGNFRNVPYPQITGDMDWSKWSEALKAAGVEFLIRDTSPAQRQLSIPIDSRGELEALAECHKVVAMRFHLVLAAAAMGVVPIPIGYCPKVKRLSRQLGLSDICLEMHQPERLGAAAEYVDKKGPELRALMAGKVAQLRLRASEILEDAVERVKKACYA